MVPGLDPFTHRGGDFVEGRGKGLVQGIGAFAEGTIEGRSLGPLGFVEVGVARAQGESVGFPDSGSADDLDVEIEIADHAPDHGELLKILFTEDGEIGLGEMKQLGDDRADTGEECPTPSSGKAQS